MVNLVVGLPSLSLTLSAVTLAVTVSPVSELVIFSDELTKVALASITSVSVRVSLFLMRSAPCGFTLMVYLMWFELLTCAPLLSITSVVPLTVALLLPKFVEPEPTSAWLEKTTSLPVDLATVL